MTRRPTGFDWLIRLTTGDAADVILGDLDEEWSERCRDLGRGRALIWYLNVTTATAWSGVWGGEMMGRRERTVAHLGLEFRHEARALLRAPLWSGLAVGTVAVGVLFTLVVISLAQAMLTSLLPYPDSERLYYLTETNGRSSGVADPTLRRVVDRRDVFEAVAAWSPIGEANLARPDAEPEIVRHYTVLPGSFEILGYRPTLGRAFEPTDEPAGSQPVAVLSHGYWLRAYGGDRNALGTSVTVSDREYTVVGVMPAGTRLPVVRVRGSGAQADVWTPLQRLPDLEGDPAIRYDVVVRAGPGVGTPSLEGAGAQVLQDLRQELPQWRTDASWRVLVRPLGDHLRADGPSTVRALLGAAALLLVLAGANLVALTSARAQARAREFVVHTALGAPPSLALRRLLAQNALVAALGAGTALAAGVWVLDQVRSEGVRWLPGADLARLDVYVTALTVLIAFGLCIAVAVSASRILPSLGSSELLRSSGPNRRWRFVSRGLVLVETAMVVSLLAGSGLIVRSLQELARVDTGLAFDDRVVTRVDLSEARYPDSEAVRRFTTAFLEQAERSPAILSAAASSATPLNRTGWNFVVIEGSDPDADNLPVAELEEISPLYPEVIGLSVVRGRDLEPSDYGSGSLPVVLINESLAALFPDADAVGRLLGFRGGAQLQVVGVVRNMAAGRLDQAPAARVYLTDMDHAFPWTVRTRWIVARLSGPESAGPAAAALRDAVRALDADLPLLPPRGLAELRADLLAPARFQGLVFAVLGAVALILGAGGIFGVVSHALATARREAGIRLALGASRIRVFRKTVAGEALAVAGGAVLGIAGAVQLGHLLSSTLFGVSPVDPPVYGAALLLTALVASVSIVVPALRSARADPAHTLRAE